jgi:hypothetical protein
MSIADTRAAYVMRLRMIMGLRVADAWPDTDEINPPMAWVFGPTSRRLDTLDGGVTRTWDVVLAVASNQADMRRAQKHIDGYLDEDGEKSIIAALEDDLTRVTGWADYGTNEVNAEAQFWGVRFSLEELT